MGRENEARALQAEFLQRAGMRSLLEFLASHSMPAELGARLWKQYGKRALDVVRGNPYILVDEELNIGFTEADRLAASIGVGAAYITYDSFNCGICGAKIGDGDKIYVGPTKAALSILYMF